MYGAVCAVGISNKATVRARHWADPEAAWPLRHRDVAARPAHRVDLVRTSAAAAGGGMWVGRAICGLAWPRLYSRPLQRWRNGGARVAAAAASVGAAAAVNSCVPLPLNIRCDDDYSEPLGGTAVRTVSVAAAAVAGAGLALYYFVDSNASLAEVEGEPTPEPVLPAITHSQIKAGYTGKARYTCEKHGWTYEGGWKNGVRHGPQGKLIRDTMTVTGPFVDGKLHGHGILQLDGDTDANAPRAASSGDRYVGEFNQGAIEGHGQYLSAKGGWSYDGSWLANQFHGHGSWINPKQGTVRWACRRWYQSV